MCGYCNVTHPGLQVFELLPTSFLFFLARAHEDAGRPRPEAAEALQGLVGAHEYGRGHAALERADAEVRDGAARLDAQAGAAQLLLHPARVKVEVEPRELVRSLGKGALLLAAQGVAQH